MADANLPPRKAAGNLIKSIETDYDGVRFRSRTEARWAVFFNIAGMPWRYEPEGFEFDGERYVPDFWLPREQIYFEVKGEDPPRKVIERLCRFSDAIGKRLYLAVDAPRIDTLVTDIRGLVENPDFPDDIGWEWGWFAQDRKKEDVVHLMSDDFDGVTAHPGCCFYGPVTPVESSDRWPIISARFADAYERSGKHRFDW